MILSRLDLMACVKELGGLESTPPDKFRRKSWGVEKTVGGFIPPNPPTTKSLLFTEMHDMCVSGGASELKDVHL